MNKKFAVFDIDGTVIRWQLYHAIVNQLAKQGDISPAANNKIHEARMVWKRRGSNNSFQEYESTLVHAYWESLAKITPNAHDQAVNAVFDEYKDQVYTYTRDLIKSLKEQGYLLFAISGSHQEIIDKLAKHYGFDAAIGQAHEVKNGRFTGHHTTPMLMKDKELAKLVKQFGASYAGSIGVGDSASDIKMLKLVEQPIAFNPEQKLFEAAKMHGWPIVIERKNVIYELSKHDNGYQLAV